MHDLTVKLSEWKLSYRTPHPFFLHVAIHFLIIYLYRIDMYYIITKSAAATIVHGQKLLGQEVSECLLI